MLKVLIADDEPHFRRYMQQVLDWEREGFCICANCKNSKEVLGRIQEVLPDIALLDINMAGMDGLALAERMKAISPEMVIVFVTGYAEFEYARKAVQIGADEYIVKPFTKEELLAVMHKIKLKLKKEADIRKNRKMEREILKEELLKRCIHGNYVEKERQLCRNLERVGISFREVNFLVSVIEIDRIMNMRNRKEDIGLWKFAITNIAEEIVSEEEATQTLFQDYEDRVISIVNYGAVMNIQDRMQHIFERVSQAVKEYLGFTISVGIGEGVEGIAKLEHSYRCAMEAMEEKFFLGGSRVVCFQKKAEQDKKAYFYRLDLNDSLLAALRKHEKMEISRLLTETKQKITDKHIPADYAYLIISGMLSICLSYIAEMNGDITTIYGDDFSPYSQIYHASSIDASFEFLEKVYSVAVDAFQTTYSRRGREILNQVEEYIQMHYQDTELTVESIAQEVYLDSSYIRRIVSRQTGGTVSDLITSVRMNKAREMLTQDYTVSETAERVGYSEAGYFSKCFKKYYGVSPSSYIRNQEKTGQ